MNSDNQQVKISFTCSWTTAYLLLVAMLLNSFYICAQDDQLEIILLQKEAERSINKRNFDQARALLLQSGRYLLENQSDSLLFVNDLLYSKYFMYQQAADSAIRYAQKAFEKALELEDPDLLGNSYLALGEAYIYTLNEPYQALLYFQEAEKILFSNDDVHEKYRVYYNLLVSNRRVGKIDNARQYGILLTALIEDPASGFSTSTVANAYFVIGNNYLEMYSPKALDYFLLADSLSTQKLGPGNFYQINYYYPQIAIYYNQIGNYRLGLQYLEKIEQVDSKRSSQSAQVVINKAWTFLYLEDYTEANLLARAYLELAKNRTDSAFAYKTLGRIALERGNPDESITWLQIALTLRYPELHHLNLPTIAELQDPYEESDIFGFLGYAHLQLAITEESPEDLARAHQYLWFGLEIGLKNRPKVKHHNAQVTLSRHIKFLYTALLDYYWHLHQAEGAAAYTDTAAMLINHAKSSILKTKSRMYRTNEIPDSLKKNRNKIIIRLRELQRQSRSALEIFRSFTELEQVEEQIAQYQSLHDEPVLQLLPSIDKETLSINYLWGEKALYAVTDGAHQTFMKRNGVGELDTLITKFYATLSEPNVRSFEVFRSTGVSLFDKLLEPLLPTQLPDRLLVLGDEKLLLIPFEALPTSTEGTNFYSTPYLIKETDVAYAPYLSKPVDTQEKLGQQAASFAYNAENERSLDNYLKNAERESMAMANVFPTTNYVGTAASESHYKEAVQQASIQHLGVHGTAKDEIPYLEFRNEEDSSNDGKLYEYEIYNMQIPAELVLLTACESNMGEIASSEGAISLTRAFLGAGAQSVISSLWTLNDDSSIKLFEVFLKSYEATRDPGVALSQAKRDYLERADEITAHPYFWSGLQFNTTKIQSENTDYLWALWLLTIPILFLLLKNQVRDRA